MDTTEKTSSLAPVAEGERVVRNIFRERYRLFVEEEVTYDDMDYLQLDDRRPPGTGLHALRIKPGGLSPAHEHTSDEWFYVLEGDLVDHDGVRYEKGDMVLLRAGTRHSSHSPSGCLLLVYIDTFEKPLEG